jgi:predicted CXXCH cytochrome family protein
MKKLLILLLAFSVIGGIGVVLASIVNSSHDLRTFGGVVGATSQICVYCHTPHNANTDTRVSYLWNRNVSATDYSVYDGTYTDPLTSNTSHTLMCMSCHDGTTTAIGQMLNPPADYDGSQDTIYVTGDANLGSELTNDHPIDLVYLNDTEGGPLPSSDYNSSSSVTTAGIRLFTFGANSNVMTCASCHEPHNKTGLDAFLRITSNQSQLCTTCHNL